MSTWKSLKETEENVKVKPLCFVKNSNIESNSSGSPLNSLRLNQALVYFLCSERILQGSLLILLIFFYIGQFNFRNEIYKVCEFQQFLA